jgi:carboxyl-terminal processing protease
MANMLLRTALPLLLGPALALSAQTPAAADERAVMRALAERLPRAHLSGKPIDDACSEHAWQRYLDDLDPRRLYFLQSDVDEFAPQKDRLDDMLAAGDAKFAYAVFDRFRERVTDRTRLAEQLAGEDLDFTVEEELVLDPQLRAWARDDDEARARWRQQIKYEWLSLEAQGLDGKAVRERLTRRYQNFRKRIDRAGHDDALAAFLNAICTSFDPHTNYLPPASRDDLEIQIRLDYEGIGAQLQEVDGMVTIARVLPGGAVERQGKIHAGDRIVSIGEGEGGPMEDVVGVELDEVVRRIRGPAGSIVRLGIAREAGGPVRIDRIVRARTELREQTAHGEMFEVPSDERGPLRIGVIDLPAFYGSTSHDGPGQHPDASRDVRALLTKFAAEGADAVVLDLRRNGGGLLPEAVEITGLFIDRGVVVGVKGPGNRVRPLGDYDPGVAWDGPLVVLISRFSASASEIVAGAIQDYGRGLVVGDSRTHGKGTVQTLVDLGGDGALGALKVTIQQFYRPGGRSTQLRGVASDVELPSMLDAIASGESSLQGALPFDEIEPLPYGRGNAVDTDLAQQLAQTSLARLAESVELTELDRRAARYRQWRDRKTVPLQRDTFLALQRELAEAERGEVADEEETAAEPESEPDGKIRRDAYLDEVFAVTADYVRLLAERARGKK